SIGGGVGSPPTATYRFAVPGGAWSNVANGAYTAVVQLNQVRNTAGTTVPAGRIGSFQVFVPLHAFVVNANDSGPGSLRQAIIDTNASPTVDTISLDSSFFATPRTIEITSELLVTDDLTITGPGSNLLTIRPA